jgi:GAF domain-containing protein
VFNHGQPVFRSGQGAPLPAGTVFGKGVRTPVFETVACLPLHVHRRTRGVLGLAHEGGLAVSEELHMFLRMTAEQLALFLETLYLKTRLDAPGEPAGPGSGA